MPAFEKPIFWDFNNQSIPKLQIKEDEKSKPIYPDMSEKFSNENATNLVCIKENREIKKVKQNGEIVEYSSLENTDYSNICKICLNEKSTTALIPCGHKHFCEKCAQKIIGKKCPICNKISNSSIKIYDE